MNANLITQFKGHNYLNLETFRKNGVAVQTPVWFVEQDGVLYVHTQAESGKVKRIRNNSRIRLAPSDMRGAPLGDWLEGQATLLDSATGDQINKLFGKKYGLQWTAFGLSGRLRKTGVVKIAIKLGEE